MEAAEFRGKRSSDFLAKLSLPRHSIVAYAKTFATRGPPFKHVMIGGRQQPLYPEQAASGQEASMAKDSDDNARFRNVVLPHLEEAYTLARWITRNRGDADDVVQDACLRAFRAIRSYSGGNARAWVLTIVRNTAYTWLRKNRSAFVVQVEDIESIEDTLAFAGNPEVETPETLLIAENDAVRLEAAIAALPDAFRETLVLRDVQGLEYREIASITGVPIGTVMSRLARGRSRLIADLRGNEP
jgi:RNA polymerase sigma factor (sigma-70 family)